MELGEFHVAGWDRLVPFLQVLQDEVDYVTLAERTGRSNEESLGRLNLNADAAELREATESPMERVLGWLKTRILEHCTGEELVRLRLYAYRPKGEGKSSVNLLVTSCQNLTLQTASQGAEEVVQQLALARGTREERQTGNLIDQTISTARNLTEVAVDLAQGIGKHYQGALIQLGHELEATRQQNDKLVQSIIQHRIDHAETRAAQLVEEGRKNHEDKRLQITEQLGKQALDQMGGLVGVLAAQQLGTTIDPQLRPLLDAVSKNATLLDALKNPAVQDLLNQPAAAEALAHFIQSAAQQAQTAHTTENKK